MKTSDSMSSRLVAVALLAATLIACERPPTPPVTDTLHETEVVAPVLLLSPAPEGRFRQNDPTIGCTLHHARGYGFQFAFDWRDVPQAEAYDIVFWQRNARFAAITRRVTESEFIETSCNSFVIDANLNDWVWKVAAIGKLPIQTDSGVMVRDTVLWSEERVYGFEPCRLSSGQPCNAPPGPASQSVGAARLVRREANP